MLKSFSFGVEARSLSLEATYINQNFGFQSVLEDVKICVRTAYSAGQGNPNEGQGLVTIRALNLHEFGACEDALYGPLSEFAVAFLSTRNFLLVLFHIYWA